MNIRSILITLVVSVLICGSGSIHGSQTPDSPDSAIQQAIDIVCTVNGKAPLGHFVVPLQRKNWGSLFSDGDLGPFLKSGDKIATSVVIVIPSQANMAPTFAVYFAGETPTWISVIPSTVKKLTPEKVLSSRLPIPKTIKSCACDLSYEPGSLTADNGSPIHTYQISTKNP